MGLFSKKQGGTPPEIQNALQGLMSQGAIFWILKSGSEGYTPELRLTMPTLPQGAGTPYAQLLTLFDGEDKNVLDNAVRALRRDGEGFEIVVASLDGRIFDVTGTRVFQSVKDGKDPFADLVNFMDRTRVYQHLGSLEDQGREQESLNKSLSALINAVPFPMWIRRQNLSLAMTNKAYQIAVGNEEGAEIARTLADADGKALARHVLKNGEAAAKQGNLVMAGKRRYVEVVERPFPDQALGEMRSYLSIGYLRDLTQMAEFQRQLATIEKGHEKVLEMMVDAIAIYGPDKRLSFFNSAFSDIWGVERAFLSRRPNISEILDRLRQKRTFPEFANFRDYKTGLEKLFTSLVDTQEELLHLPDGRSIRQRISPHPAGGLLFLYEDVSENLQLVSSYNTLLQVQRETMDKLKEAVGVYGSDGRLKVSNPVYRRLWNLPEKLEDLEEEYHLSDVLEKNQHLYDGENWVETKYSLLKTLLKREYREHRLSRRDRLILDMAVVPLPDGAVLHRYMDVTDQLKVERALRERNEALESAEKMRSDFLMNVSYALRTPLTTLMGYADLLALEKNHPEFTKHIQSASQTLNDLVNDVIDLATIQAGKRPFICLSLNLQKTVEESLDIFSNVPLRINLDEPIQIIADAGAVKQAIRLWIRHTRDHLGREGEITILSEHFENSAALIIEDTGFTFREEDRRASQGARAALGLPLLSALMHGMGGEMSLEHPPRGTRLILSFPLAHDQKNEIIPQVLGDVQSTDNPLHELESDSPKDISDKDLEHSDPSSSPMDMDDEDAPLTRRDF